jgi:NAD-dependent SIR2 family protein deacetylase
VRSGLWSLGCRGYNVKLLKLHGSMIWLQCPNCQRLFVQFGLKEEILECVGHTLCRHCHRSGYENQLTGSLVMPTFLKDLSNFQIKLVSQNAGVELMEAKRLVFIGYALPNADFEFRQLLSRMVDQDAVVEVVLYEGPTDDKRRYKSEQNQYRQFFGSRDLRFHSNGVVDFVSSLVEQSS